MKKKVISILCISALAITLIMSGCTEEEENTIQVEKEEVEENAYTTILVQRGTVTHTEEILMQGKQGGEESFSFGLDGRKVSIYVVKGDIVTKGQLLAEVELNQVPEEMQELEYQVEADQLLLKQLNEQMEADITVAQKLCDYEYMDIMYKQKIEQEKEKIRDRYQPSIESCEDRIYTAQNRLAEYNQLFTQGTIYAPFDGIITLASNALDGTLSQAGRKIVSLADTAESIYVTKGVQYLEYFSEGQTMKARQGKGDATVEFQVMPQDIDQWETGMTFVAYGDTTGVDTTKNAYVVIPIEEKKDTLYIQNKALHSAEGFYYVYLQDSDGQRTMQEVQIGIQGNEVTEITSGLKEGQEIIVK